MVPAHDDEALMEAVYSRGPLAVTIDAAQPGFRFYSGGSSSPYHLMACPHHHTLVWRLQLASLQEARWWCVAAASSCQRHGPYRSQRLCSRPEVKSARIKHSVTVLVSSWLSLQNLRQLCSVTLRCSGSSLRQLHSLPGVPAEGCRMMLTQSEGLLRVQACTTAPPASGRRGIWTTS